MSLRHAALTAFAIAIFSLAAANRALAGDTLPGPVVATLVRVIDGDTIEVRARIWLGQTIATRVRLAGIDTPELRGDCPRERGLAIRAARLLRDELGDEDSVPPPEVRLRDVTYGKFAGRVLARVESAAGRDLSTLLMARGLARPYKGGRRRSWCPQLGESTSP